VNPVRHLGDQPPQELGCFHLASLCEQLGVGIRAGPVDGDKEIALPFLRADFRDVDVEVADRVPLELLARRFLAVDIGKTADSMPLSSGAARSVSGLGWCSGAHTGNRRARA
jgi:hypothetical protein